jgi:predicted phage-related endonuclease
VNVPVSQRTGYLGGSDWYELLEGCHLRLWRQKRGIAPPVEQEKTGAMTRGSKLEPLILEEYKEQTGRKPRKVNSLITHRQFPWFAAHVDAMESRGTRPHHERWVVECKSAAPFVFRTFQREGIHPHYIAQGQHYCLVTGAAGVTYAVLEPVDWQFATFDVPRDDAMIAGLLANAQTFWAKVENGPSPDKLEPDDKRCRKCIWRQECHPDAPVVEDLGDAVRDDELVQIAQKTAEARKISAEADRWKKECEDTLREALGKRTNVVAGDLQVTNLTSQRKGYTVADTTVTTLRIKGWKG